LPIKRFPLVCDENSVHFALSQARTIPFKHGAHPSCAQHV
jgi:hypothetical protein